MPGRPKPDVVRGSMYRAIDIGLDEDCMPCVKINEVEAVSDGYEWWHCATRFCKLPPAEPEFISLIRSLGVPKRVREDA